MKKLMLVLMLFCFVLPCFAQTKTSAVVDAWAEIAEDSLRVGAATTVSDSYSTQVIVDVAATANSTTTPIASDGTYINVQISALATGDTDWTTIPGGKILVLKGTAALEAVTNSPAAGTSVFTCAATAGFEAGGASYIFIEDTGTPANSEILLQKSHVTDTSVTTVDGMTNAHDTSDILSNMAVRKIFHIAMSFKRVRVIIDHTFDDDATAPSVFSRTTVSEVDSLS